MKKFIGIFLCLVMIFTFSSCVKNYKDSSDISVDSSEPVSEETGSDKNTSEKDGEKDTKVPEVSSKETPSSKDADSNSSSKKFTPQGIVTNKDKIPENTDNGVLEKTTSQEMEIPENMQLLTTNNAKEENNTKNIKVTAAIYHLDGDVVNWMTEKDLIYVITSGNNRLVVINSKNMMAVSNIPLAGKPAEINLVGDKIYISLPDLCRIDIFSKSNFEKLSSLNFEHEVSSFCIDGEYIYYSEHDQGCDVYKKNMTTNELTEILPDRGWSFYRPKLYLNKEDNILYIGETGSSGSTLFYYDATTLQLKSLFRKDNYGMWNHTRDIFHVGDDIFWGNYRLSDTDAKQIIGRYGESNNGSVNFVSKEVVSTFEGLFLTDTYECIIDYFDSGFKFEYILVSESGNVFFRKRSIDENIIIGVSF